MPWNTSATGRAPADRHADGGREHGTSVGRRGTTALRARTQGRRCRLDHGPQINRREPLRQIPPMNDHDGQPDLGRLCPLPHPRGGRRLGVGVGGFGGGQDQGGADRRILVGREPGTDGSVDRAVAVLGGGQGVGGVVPEYGVGVGVVEKGLQEGGVGGDRGPGGRYDQAAGQSLIWTP
ncbi:hypothetical protein [Streptomyces sp. NPDC002265]|uniref:hypothetical protein n=1 Tax=Streptomyces sp. NPDC002265 TaxID=3154415 RepID=UPI003320FBCF